MKKKVILSLLTPIICLSTGGCFKNVGMKLTYGTYLTSEDDSINDAIKINYAELSSRMDVDGAYRNENFLLAIAPTNGCVCWAKFQAVLKQFIKDTHYVVYQINWNEFGENNNFGLTFQDGHVTFAIVRGSKIVKQYMSNPVLDSVEALKAEVDKFVRAPDLYYVDEPFLNDIIKYGETTLVQYIRGTCSDCNYVDPNVLWPYLHLRDLKTPMYVIDIDYLYQTKDKSTDYQDFKNEYRLSDVRDQNFGYGNGYVPTFQYYERGKLLDASVFFNDEIARVGEEIKVVNSYYTEERLSHLSYAQNIQTNVLKGLTLSEDDVLTFNGELYWRQDKAAAYHKPLLEAFLKTYTK